MKNATCKTSEPIFNTSWSKSWSGRGTEIMNRMENINTPDSRNEIFNLTSGEKKLDLLLTKYPNNEFYRSLKNWVNSGKQLTEKQCQAIDKTFYKTSW